MRKLNKLGVVAVIMGLSLFLAGCNITLPSLCKCGAPAYGGPGDPQHVMNIFRQNRQAERFSQVAILESIVSSEYFSEQAKRDAEEHLFVLLGNIAFETSAEHILFTKYWIDDVVVLRSGQNVNVIIRRSENLTTEQTDKVVAALIAIDETICSEDVFISVVE